MCLACQLACHGGAMDDSGVSVGVSAGVSAGGTSTTGPTTTTEPATASAGSSGGESAVDLACDGVAWEPAAPMPGQPITLRADVRNHGTGPLGQVVRVSFRVDGTPITDGALAALGPGETSVVTGSMPWPSPAAGSFKIEALVDADQEVAEASEDDNLAAAVLEVMPPAGACRELGPWASSAPFADAGHVSHPLPSFASHGHYFVHTKTLDGAEERILYSAQPQADGSLTPWQVAWPDHGGGPHGYTGIDVDGFPAHFRNGHIARYVVDDQGLVQSIDAVEENVDTSFGGNRYVWDSAVYAALPSGPRWIIHLGGFSFTGYTYRPNVYRGEVPVTPMFTSMGIDHPAERPGRAAFFGIDDFGFVITGESGAAALWSSRLTADGAMAAWSALPELPPGTGNERGELIAAGRSLLAIRGSRVVRADLRDDGTLTPWIDQPSLPEDQVDMTWGDGHLEGAAHGILGEFVYVTGTKQVHHARLVPAACAP